MARSAATSVHVHREDGDPVVFDEGDEIPGWAQKLITNDAVYLVESDEDTTSEEPSGYEDMTLAQLKKLLKERELPQSGTTAELISRLRESDEDTTSEE